MAKVEDCPGFETFGADVKAARKAKHLTRKVLAEIVGIEWRYLANIENKGTIPSLPVVIQLIKVCGLPWSSISTRKSYEGDSEQRQRVSHKLKTLPGTLFAVIEGAIDGALKIDTISERNGGCVKASSVFRFARGPQGSLIFLPFFQRNPVFCGQLDVLRSV